MLKKLLGGLLLVACAQTGSARAQGFSSQMTVVSIHARDSATDAFVSGFNNPMSCSNPQYFRIENGLSNGDMIRATLLTAYATGKPVTVWVHSCATDGVSVVTSVWAGP
jgi:hypothetical protein